MSNAVADFAIEVVEVPISDRRIAVRNWLMSLRMRALAAGFLFGLASSFGLWLYERRGLGGSPA